MPIEGQIISNTISAQTSALFVAKVSIIFLSGLYFIFSLIVMRQIALMTETVISDNDPYLRAFGIIHSGVALGLIILFIGFLFG